MIVMFLEIQNCPTYNSQENKILFTHSPEYSSAFFKQQIPQIKYIFFTDINERRISNLR